MNIVLYGAGRKSLIAASIVRENCPEIDIEFVVEGFHPDKIGRKLSGENNVILDCLSLTMLGDLYYRKKVDAVAIPSIYKQHDVWDAIKQCVKAGIEEDDIYLIQYNFFYMERDVLSIALKSNGLFGGGGGFIPLRRFAQMKNLNVHVVEHCNFNCKGCGHFSSIADREYFYDIKSFSNDFAQLAKIIPDIYAIDLLGGEALLHDDIADFFHIARENFPYSKISLVSNGILLSSKLPKIKSELQRNNINLLISCYPPMKKNFNSLLLLLKENGIYPLVSDVHEFCRLCRPEPLFDKYESRRRCAPCRLLWGGRIYACAMAAGVKYFNRKFGAVFPEDSGIDLHSGLNGVEILRQLEQPINMCAHCIGTGHDVFPWSSTQNPCEDDWYTRYTTVL